ncbi:MAG: hypothetical protein WCT23_01320 [Candidatus Neomarinimicrobiota bacterium]
MKRIVIVLLALALATFAFAEGFCFKGYVNGGINEPGMLGTSVGGYYHNTTETGYNVRLGARKHLNDFYVMPEALPLELQFGLGFQQNPAKGSTSEDLTALTFNMDFLYPVHEIVSIPLIGISPFLGLEYDFHMYRNGNGGETWNAHMIGINAGIMFDLDLSERLALELTMANPFNFGLSSRIPKVFTSQAYANLGLSYVFEL